MVLQIQTRSDAFVIRNAAQTHVQASPILNLPRGPKTLVTPINRSKIAPQKTQHSKLPKARL
jgi:hypothetical protein